MKSDLQEIQEKAKSISKDEEKASLLRFRLILTFTQPEKTRL